MRSAVPGNGSKMASCDGFSLLYVRALGRLKGSFLGAYKIEWEY